MNNIVEWYLKPFKKYADFTGRARRKEYWTFVLVNFLISIILSGGGQAGTGPQILSSLFSLFVLIPSLAVAVRRLHDIGRSGFWLFILFIPIIGFFVILFFLLQDSEPGSNEYGPNPKSTEPGYSF